MFKLALIQMLVSCGEKEKNLTHAETLIAQAAEAGADIALLPECMDLGWTYAKAREEAEAIPAGEPCRRLCDAAKRNNIFVCSGLTERDKQNTYNAAVIIDRNGDVLCKHRKLNELGIGHPYYDQGDRLNVVHTEFGTLGLMICADGFAKDLVLSRSLCYMGADIILSPSAWAVKADHDQALDPYGTGWRKAYKPVAKEYSTWIVGVSNVGPITSGPWAGRKCIGCSLVIDHQGSEILQGPYGEQAEEILYVDVKTSPRPARGADWKKGEE